MKELRKEIDQIDDRIIDLLTQRMALSKRVGEHKKKQGMKIEDKDRENELIQRLVEKGKTLDPELIKKIYEIIFQESKKIQ